MQHKVARGRDLARVHDLRRGLPDVQRRSGIDPAGVVQPVVDAHLERRTACDTAAGVIVHSAGAHLDGAISTQGPAVEDVALRRDFGSASARVHQASPFVVDRFGADVQGRIGRRDFDRAILVAERAAGIDVNRPSGTHRALVIVERTAGGNRQRAIRQDVAADVGHIVRTQCDIACTAGRGGDLARIVVDPRRCQRCAATTDDGPVIGHLAVRGVDCRRMSAADRALVADVTRCIDAQRTARNDAAVGIVLHVPSVQSHAAVAGNGAAADEACVHGKGGCAITHVREAATAIVKLPGMQGQRGIRPERLDHAAIVDHGPKCTCDKRTRSLQHASRVVDSVRTAHLEVMVRLDRAAAVADAVRIEHDAGSRAVSGR